MGVGNQDTSSATVHRTMAATTVNLPEEIHEMETKIGDTDMVMETGTRMETDVEMETGEEMGEVGKTNPKIMNLRNVRRSRDLTLR